MANKTLSQFTYSSEKMPCNLYAQITFGASGAPTLNYGGSSISSVVRNSAGDYTITFRDVWYRLMGVDHVFNSGNSAPAAPEMWIKANSVATLGTQTLRIVFNAAGVATDPASGEIVYIKFAMKNSSV